MNMVLRVAANRYDHDLQQLLIQMTGRNGEDVRGLVLRDGTQLMLGRLAVLTLALALILVSTEHVVEHVEDAATAALHPRALLSILCIRIVHFGGVLPFVNPQL